MMTQNDKTAKVGRECVTLFTDPSRKAEARRAQAKGGRNSAGCMRRPRHLDTAADLDQALTWVWSQVSQKRMSKDDATLLLKVIDLRSNRLASSTLADLAAKVNELEKGIDGRG